MNNSFLFLFAQLHLVIQAAFGWNNAYCYELISEENESGLIISLPECDAERQILNSRKYTIGEYLNVEEVWIYIYDFADNWWHYIKVEEVFESNPMVAICIGGEGKAPPEDVGSTSGFITFKKAINDPEHTEYYELREQVGLKEDGVIQFILYPTKADSDLKIYKQLVLISRLPLPLEQ